MYATISKRFEFSASRQVRNPSWSEVENRHFFGPAVGGHHGHGINGVVYLIFSGPIDPATGMMINISQVKARGLDVLNARYDHRFLNVDTPPFDRIPPTASNLARQVLDDVAPLFSDTSAIPVVCHIADTDSTGATAYIGGAIEEYYLIDFSAARATRSPHLTDAENQELFGQAASLHGHNYRLRVVLSGECPRERGVMASREQVTAALKDVRDLLDHRCLSSDFPLLADMPTTTESLVRFIYDRLAGQLPVARVRLHEMENFFAECDKDHRISLGLSGSFHAAHCLHSTRLSEAENEAAYGKCARENGHGHQYQVEATVGGAFDERSGTLFRLDRFSQALNQAIEPWSYKHLNLETDDFKDMPTSGEHIISKLWARLDPLLDNRLTRLRLWETPNNRFTLRSQTPTRK